MYPYNHKFGQRIQTDAGTDADRGFIAHLAWSAAQAPAADDDGIATIALGAEEQTIADVASPAVARALQIVGTNAAATTGDVVISGENIAGAKITETITLNGTTAKNGTKAFRKIDSIKVPAGLTTAVKQVETATAAVGAAVTAGDITVTVKSGLFEADEAVTVAIEADAEANDVAAAIRTALAANDVVKAHYDVSGATAAVILTAKVAAANDTDLNIAIAGGDTGVTDAASSANTTAGVAPDYIKVGWNDILGIPYKLAHNTVLAAALNNAREANAPTVTVSATAIESNTVKLSSALAGQAVDVYLIV